MCELNKISEQGWKKPEDNSRIGTEYSRIITDPNTGKCYCRGKVLGKVMGLILMLILFQISYLFKSMLLIDVKIVILFEKALLFIVFEHDCITFVQYIYLSVNACIGYDYIAS